MASRSGHAIVELASPAVLKQRLQKIVFRLAWVERNEPRFGTGFFLSASGLALTAFHNLPPPVRKDPAVPIRAEFQGEAIEFHWLLTRDENRRWQEDNEVAVLQGPAGLLPDADLLPCSYLSLSLKREKRSEFWSARPVALMGFSLENGFALGLPVLGTLSTFDPIQDPVTIQKTRVVTQEALAFGPDVQRQLVMLQGVSGAPVYDRQLDELVAVQFAVNEDTGRVYACEFRHLAQQWPEFRRMGREIVRPKKEDWEPALPDKGRTGRPWLAAMALLLVVAALSALVWRFWAEPARLADPPSATPLTLTYSVEKRVPRGNAEEVELLRLSENIVLRAGDEVRFRFSTSRPGYLYLFNQTATGDNYIILFPSPSTNRGSSYLYAGHPTLVPERSWFQMGSQKRRERFFLIYSLLPLRDLERLRRFANPEDLGVIRGADHNRPVRELLHAAPHPTRVSRDSVYLLGTGWLLIGLIEL